MDILFIKIQQLIGTFQRHRDSAASVCSGFDAKGFLGPDRQGIAEYILPGFIELHSVEFSSLGNIVHIRTGSYRITEMLPIGQAIHVCLGFVAAVEGLYCVYTGVQGDLLHIVSHAEGMCQYNASFDCIDFIEPLFTRPVRCVRMVQQPLLVRPIDQAFIIGEKFIGNDSACLVLGDNIFHGTGLSKMLREAVRTADQEQKATVFGYRVNDPERYGVAEFDKEGNCLSIEEKPAQPKSNYAVVGLYFYPNKVVEVAKNIKPSARGELEITTVNQKFLEDGELKVQTLGRGFAWLDTGTHDSLSEASTFVEVLEKRQGLKIACLEGIAYRNHWIDEDTMRQLAQPMIKNQYGQYLLKVIDELKEMEL